MSKRHTATRRRRYGPREHAVAEHNTLPDGHHVHEFIDVDDGLTIGVHHDGTLTDDAREAFRELARAMRDTVVRDRTGGNES